VLAYLFRVDDEIAEDFDFVRSRIARASQASEADATEEGYAGQETGLTSIEEEPVVDRGQPVEREKDDLDFIDLTQTRIVRFVGTAGESVELKFVTSGQRESMISKLDARRAALEAEIANASAATADDMAHLARLEEEDQRLRHSKTIDDVENLIDLILAHTRWRGAQPAGRNSAA
jgi:hypothetical protein